MNEKKHILKSVGILSSSTIISRILGLIRDIFTASIFGTGMIADAFVIAFMLPNLLRRLFGEGALSSAFIPVFSEYLSTKRKKSAFLISSIVISFLIVILSSIVILVILLTQVIPHFFSLSEKMTLTLNLLAIMAPYMLFICLAAFFMALLNSFRHFVIPAISPIVLNVIWILTLIFLCPQFGSKLSTQIYGLAIGVLFAGAVQLFIHIPIAVKKGFYFKFNLNFQNPAIKKIKILMIPIVLAYTVNQLNILVDIVLAYLLGDGMQSSLWYSERLIQFPLGVFAIAMSVAIFPSMSRFAAKKQFNKLLETLSYAMRIIFIIILPCMAIIVTLKTPIIQLLFERGNFNVLSTSNTAYALFFYSFGLLAYAGIKIILPAYYSIQDSKTPIKFALISLGINIVLNLILMHPLKQGGLALATSIAATVNFLLLSIHINKKIGVLDWEKIFICFIKMLIISIVMGFVCHFTHLFINNIQFNMLKKFYNVFIPISAGFLSLILFGYLFKLNEMFDLFKLFKKTKK